MIEISSNIENIVYLFSASLFIIGLKRLASPNTARNGNRLASLGMLIAIVLTILKYTDNNIEWIIIGIFIGGLLGIVLSKYVQMTAIPQLVAIFNGFGGFRRIWEDFGEFCRGHVAVKFHRIFLDIF